MLHCQQVLGIAPIVLHWRAHESKATPAQWRPNFHYFGIFGQFLKPDWRQWVAWLSPDLSKDCFEHLGPGAARLRISKKKKRECWISAAFNLYSKDTHRSILSMASRPPDGTSRDTCMRTSFHSRWPGFWGPSFFLPLTGQLRNTSYNLDGSSLSTIP